MKTVYDNLTKVIKLKPNLWEAYLLRAMSLIGQVEQGIINYSYVELKFFKPKLTEFQIKSIDYDLNYADKLNPGSTLVFFYKGILFSDFDYKKSLYYFTTILQEKTKYFVTENLRGFKYLEKRNVMFNRAKVHAKFGNYVLALVDFARHDKFRINCIFENPFKKFMEYLKTQKSIEEIKNIFIKSLQVDNKNEFIYLRFGNFLRENGNLDNALIQYFKIIQLKQLNDVRHHAYHFIAVIYFIKQNYPQALVNEHYANLSIGARESRTYDNILQAIEAKSYEEQVKIYEKAVELSKRPSIFINVDKFHFHLASLHLDAENYNLAEKVYLDLVEFAPSRHSYVAISYCYVKQKNYIKAINYYRKAKELPLVYDDYYGDEILSNDFLDEEIDKTLTLLKSSIFRKKLERF